MSSAPKVPGLPHSVLRPRFWEVAADRGDKAFATPFERHRVLESLDASEMAGRMSMTEQDYMAFEQGRVRPIPVDIMTFCVALDLHPLDLYPEPYEGIPLPSDLRDTLMMVAQTPVYEPEYRKRARDRLVFERTQAEKMITANVDEYRHMMVSIGYSPQTLKRFNGPVYRVDDDTRSQALRDIIEGGGNNLRGMMYAYINAHQTVLEEEFIFRCEARRQMEQRKESSDATLKKFATFLYGDRGCDTAIDRLRQHLHRTPDLSLMESRLRSNPNMLWTLRQEARRGMEYNAVPGGRLDLRTTLGLFITAVRMNMLYVEFLEEQSAKIESSKKAYESFSTWREHPRMERLLDWFENWLALDNYLEGRHVEARYLIQAQCGQPGPR